MRHAKTPWTLALGGRSINTADKGKIRMEAGLPDEVIVDTMKLLVVAPALLRFFRAYQRQDLEETLELGDKLGLALGGRE